LSFGDTEAPQQEQQGDDEESPEAGS